MKIDVAAALVDRARSGELPALDALLRQIQGPVYNLALRMLGRREDAQDATQEILLKVTTRLATWRADSAFGTWVFSIAGNHLLNTCQRSPSRRELSFEALAEGLDRGLALAEQAAFDDTRLTPEDQAVARETALGCTQAMLLCLAPAGRLAYVLDVVFGLESHDAAVVQGISPAAHRQRLARAREAVHGFMASRCGLVSAAAPCRCSRQVPAKRAQAARGGAPRGLAPTAHELDQAAQGLRELLHMGDAAAVMRGSPEFQAPGSILQGIRLVVAQSAWLRQ